ncbi:WD40 repeat-like protein [Neolentinus lepideus HHB14362 ss-1]|uniref:WD40 repeat-like protein n=1 Tax=Neolentinus lepideus HHB14362 ss-1 TaxID=1314782 RepID=A0A165U0K0_9AGAM|nr:WD40 repeat-like protein [Neolentinus lepideus HHB14362 ss-1]
MTEASRKRRRVAFGSADCLNLRVYERARIDSIEGFLRRGLPYSRKLTAHTSCVNALALSSDGGRWIASAGDDLRVLLWDFHQEDVVTPSGSFLGPTSNVFTVEFSANNRYLYVGDTDNNIYKYDLSELHNATGAANAGLPCDAIRCHHDSVRSISCHPWQDEVFLSASEDGTTVLHDGRDGSSTRAQATLFNNSEFSDVKWHPGMEHIFATSDSKGWVCLRDTRMAFGPLSHRHKNGVVQTYNTTIAKSNWCSRPDISSITFDRSGMKLGVLFLHHLPTIYSITDENPLAICSSRRLPVEGPAQPSSSAGMYFNSCTIKHASFGGLGLQDDSYYATGSDDFRAYVWKIPDITQLRCMREEISFNQSEMQGGVHPPAFADNANKKIYMPVELSTPFTRLCGHQSIVNSALLHPHIPILLTAGIERNIILHSATPNSPCFQDLTETDTSVRRLYELLDVTGEDRETLALFDHLLGRQGEIDPFDMRSWALGTDPEDDDEED